MTGDRSSEDRGKPPSADSAVEADRFNRWVGEHYAAVYRYAFRLSGNQQTAEDLTQQVFLNAWRHQGQLRDPARSQSWLLTITRNQFLKQLRKSVPESFSQWELQETDIAEVSNGTDDSLKLDLQQLLLELPTAYRVVVLMFFFEGLSYREIAEELDVKIGTVMSRLARAKQRLRSMWEVESLADKQDD